MIEFQTTNVIRMIRMQTVLMIQFKTDRERNGTGCNRHNVTDRKGNFRSVRFGWRRPTEKKGQFNLIEAVVSY
uniref:Uncharacterized protein n=1 Tax=Romanomermis culicivorax TaxID=13658 RepID=A0A915J2K7_ROMCU